MNSELNPEQFQIELFRLVMKAAQRCAYDLKHASHNIPSNVMFRDITLQSFFEKRSIEWLKIFNPDGIKNYHHELHNSIDLLELRIDKYRAILKDNNIKDPYPELPF